MTLGIVAGVFVALVIWWLQELDKEFDRELVDRKLQEEREREFRAAMEDEAIIEYAMLELEIRSDSRRERLNEVIQLNNQEIDRLNRMYS